MHSAADFTKLSLAGLKLAQWRVRIDEIASNHGWFKQLDSTHFAAYLEGNETLLVTFETMQGIRALNEDAQPLGWDLVKAHGWSHLAVISDGDTWFRSEDVYELFDWLTDEGFFDEHQTILFYGTGPCGYAATAFSVAAPGCTVLAIQPQASLNPEVAEWDDRFTEERRRDFTSRYGYAPDMIDAASEVFVLYDPRVTLDAMHAALFTRPHVTKLPMRFMGATIQTHLMEMQLLISLISLAGTGSLTRHEFAKLIRARRNYPPYLRNIMVHLDSEERTHLIRMLCVNVSSRMKAPRFARRLRELDAEERRQMKD